MPNVNLTDSRSRDAVVKAETTGVDEEIRYVDDAGQSAYTRKILKATVEQDFDTLVAKHDGDPEALGKALVEGDPEVDMEICGLYLWGVSKVYVNSSDGIVYRIEQQEIVRGPDGTVKEKRPRNRPEANVDAEIPLTWTGRKIAKAEAVRRFVFASKLQVVHINGLTYDFLYGMAKELAEADSLMMVGGGSKGRDPLVFRRGSVPYRGFLEGRVEGDKYILLLHLSNLELKVPSASRKDTEEKKVSKSSSSVKTETDEKKGEGVKASKKKTSKKQAAKSPPKEVEIAEKTPESKPASKKASKSESSPKDSKHEKRKKTGEDQKVEQKQSAAKKETAIEGRKKEKSVPRDSTGQKITSEDLGIWLKSIRMGKYLDVFVENEIDVDVIAELTDSDLKELDIPLGSRRRLLKAVEETDNLHAEVAMAVKAMSAKSTGKTAKQKK